MIESLNNEKVKFWTKLNENKYRERENLFLIEGEHLVEEALSAGCLKEVIILKGCNFHFENAFYVSENVMKKISSVPNPPKIMGICEYLIPDEIKGNVLLLDRINDPGNMGTIIRSAVAFGIDTIVVSPDSVSIYNPKVLRATEGLLFHINIIECDIEKMVRTLKEKGYKIYGTDVITGKLLNETSFALDSAIVMGNEGSGISQKVKELCDEFIYIKMNKRCESLNVGVASSIILYELSKN